MLVRFKFIILLENRFSSFFLKESEEREVQMPASADKENQYNFSSLE